MSKGNGGESPPVREVGDAPNVTRTLNEPITGPTFLSSWSSPEAFAKHLKEFKAEDCWKRDNVYSKMDKSFSGIDNIQEAFNMARDGWTEGGETIERTRSYISALNPLSPRLVSYGIAGSTPNVPRAIAGNILNMRVPIKKASQKKKTITIVTNMCEAWYAGAEAICNRAAVIACLVDEIEAKGFSVEVIACATTGYYGKIKALTSVMVKESHQPIDINRLAFCLGHSAMFRGLFFASWETDEFAKSLGSGLGIVGTTVPTPEQNHEQIYTITSGHYNNRIKISLFNTVEEAAKGGLERIVTELQRQGCPAFPRREFSDVEDDEEVEEAPEWSY